MTVTNELSEQPRVSFFGVPVYGDFDEARRVEQYPIEQFAPILKAVLEHPDLAAVAWTQFTPYFDDGDACVFSIKKPGFLLHSDEEGLDGFDRYTHSVGKHPALGFCPSAWDPDQKKYVEGPYEGPDENRYRIFETFSDALEAGHFEHVLIDAFGDHAEVLLTPDRIDVTHYSHD